MRRLQHVAFAMLLAVALGGCASTAIERARSADQLREYDLAVVEYAQALRDDPDSQEAQLGLERASLRASQAHYLTGRRLRAQGRYEDALLELQIAADLNPTNADVERELRDVRLALRTQRSASEDQTELESVLARAHTLAPVGPRLPDVQLPAEIQTGSQATSREVYLMLAALADLSVTFDPAFAETPAQVSLLNDMTLTEALNAIATATGTFYRVTGPQTIVVVNNTPAKQREYLQEYEQTFVVQNADLKETIDALRVVADMRAITPITGTNTFLARDTAERLQAAGRFLLAFDKARPEIVVDVEVIEVDRTTLVEYGTQFASPMPPGVSGSVALDRTSLTLDEFQSLSRSNVLVQGIPALYYRLLKTDGRSRTLANPHIRITDGMQATASFGQEVPVPQTVITPITQGGLNIQPQTQFAYRNIGVNITITPRTHPNDEITMVLDIELSTLGGPGFDGLPTFGNRHVNTTIRLKDGETNILAGLIREEERTSRETVPGLGDIPVLGRLFGQNSRDARQTDVVVMLTPHIIRVLDITEDDLRPLLVPGNLSGVAIFETAPIPPPPVIRGGGGGGGAPLLASFPVEAGPPAGVMPWTPTASRPGKVIKN